MHCLNTINRLNAEGYAVQKAKQLVSFNKHTVVEYHGLHAVEAHGFATYREASDFIDSLLSCPGVQFQPQGAAWSNMRQVCLAQQTTGNLITDAWIAATVMQSGETLCTFDRDFSRLLPADQLLLLKP